MDSTEPKRVTATPSPDTTRSGKKRKISESSDDDISVNLGSPNAKEATDSAWTAELKEEARDSGEASHEDPLTNACQKIVKNCKSNQVQCSTCKSVIKFLQKNGRLILLQHILSHLHKPLYKCNHCDYSGATAASIQSHLKRKHQMKPSGNYNFEGTDQYRQEMIEIFDKCFGGATVKSTPPSARSDPVCDAIRHAADKCTTARIHCAMCNKDLRFRHSDTKGTKTETLRTHILRHVNKLLFSCTICEYKGVAPIYLSQHLSKVHQINHDRDQHIEDTTSDCVDEILDMVKRCFQHDIKATDGAAPCFARISTCGVEDPILDSCRLVLQNHTSKKIICNVCKKVLSIASTTRSKQPSVIRDHAMSHFDKSIFLCSHCTYETNKSKLMWFHTKKWHGNAEEEGKGYNDLSGNYKTEILDLVQQCFGETIGIEPPVQPQSARKLAKKHFVQLSKFNKSDHAICALCGLQIRFGYRSKTLFNHVYSHMDKDIFSCKECQYQCVTPLAIGRHVSDFHQLPIKSESWTDATEEYRDEYLDMINQCFPLGEEIASATTQPSGSASNDIPDRDELHYREAFGLEDSDQSSDESNPESDPDSPEAEPVDPLSPEPDPISPEQDQEGVPIPSEPHEDADPISSEPHEIMNIESAEIIDDVCPPSMPAIEVKEEDSDSDDDSTSSMPVLEMNSRESTPSSASECY